MRGRDPHTALKLDVVSNANCESFEAFNGEKRTFGSVYTPTLSFTSGGIQKTDFLFKPRANPTSLSISLAQGHAHCAAHERQRCLCKN